MIFKYFGGTVERGLSAEEDPDAEFKATVRGTAEKVRAKADSFHIADAITEIFSLFRRANKYIDETMPWALAKDEGKRARLNDVLYNLSEAILTGASLLDSFMPETSEKIFAAFGAGNRTIEECSSFGLCERITVTPAPALFARVDFKALEPEIEKICEEQRKSAASQAAGNREGRRRGKGKRSFSRGRFRKERKCCEKRSRFGFKLRGGGISRNFHRRFCEGALASGRDYRLRKGA